MKRCTILLLFLLALLPLAARCEAAQAPDFPDFSEKFPGKFLPRGATPVITGNSYQSDDVNLTITASRVENSDVYVVDIYVRSVECFQRAHAGNRFGRTTAKVRTMAENRGAIVAMTGDNGHYFTKGWSVSNGAVNRSTPNRVRDLAIVYRTGEMITVDNDAVDYARLRADADAGRLWHVFLFGPALLDANGKATLDFGKSKIRAANPRSAIGYFEPGHYCFVQVDGRGVRSALEENKTSRGLRMADLAALMERLGCKAAYNLDGGQSSMLVFGNRVYSKPYKGGRNVGDIVYIRDLPD